MNNFDYEMQSLSRELLALKTEKSKRLSQLVVSEQPITISAEANRFYNIKATPKNDVNPLITYYFNDDSATNYRTSSMFVDANYPDSVIVQFAVYNARDVEVVFVSTSELEITQL